jgi:hypothetical protein
MRLAFPDAEVTGYESLIGSMANDEKDRHVLAATVRADAEILVTFNLRDFAEQALKPFDIAAVHPDEFLLNQDRPRLPRTAGEALQPRPVGHHRSATSAPTRRRA